jgi:hypothetical protein
VDPNRFDSFAKKLGSRLSRRDMMRTSAAAAVGAVAVSKFASVAAQDADTTAKDRFIAVRTYTYTGTEQAAATGLTGLIPVMEKQPGFISYNLVFGDGQILAISTFLDETTAVAAAQQENAWITANAANILSGTPTVQSGDVFLRSELYAGCGCITGTQNSCNSERLTCCATSSNMGGPGVCLTNETTCPGAMPAEPTATAAPAQPTATTVPACTSEGCDCNGGVQDNCDDGLVCCGVTMPGGPGTCKTDAECNPPCTTEGCDCTSGTDGACDDGLCCTGASQPGGTGTCSSDCPCTSENCPCTTGEDGNCDDGLVCCAADMTDPGSPGTCMDSCDSSDCNGQEGCPCDSGTQNPCNDGLECCGGDMPGGQGTCSDSCD